MVTSDVKPRKVQLWLKALYIQGASYVVTSDVKPRKAQLWLKALNIQGVMWSYQMSNQEKPNFDLKHYTYKRLCGHIRCQTKKSVALTFSTIHTRGYVVISDIKSWKAQLIVMICPNAFRKLKEVMGMRPWCPTNEMSMVWPSHSFFFLCLPLSDRICKYLWFVYNHRANDWTKVVLIQTISSDWGS